MLNGLEIEVEPGCTIERLLDGRRPSHRGIAVEVNRAIVPRKDHGTRELRPGDSIEIVTLVGGG